MRIDTEGPDIFSFQLFSPEFCRKAVEEISRIRRWNTGAVIGYDSPRWEANPQTRRVQECDLTDCSFLADAWETSVPSVVDAAAMLCFQCKASEFQQQVKILRYERGDFFKSHYDLARSFPRILSLICYLNDNYSGGLTCFTRQQVRPKPAAGKALLFPSGISHRHEGETVTRGTKFVLTAFFS